MGEHLKIAIRTHDGQVGLTGVRIVALLITVSFFSLTAPSLCFAQVQLPAVNLGETNFEDGFSSRAGS